MKITIEINTGNAAFEDDFLSEMTRITERATQHAARLVRLDAAQTGSWPLQDSYGNTCALITVSES